MVYVIQVFYLTCCPKGWPKYKTSMQTDTVLPSKLCHKILTDFSTFTKFQKTTQHIVLLVLLITLALVYRNSVTTC